jgi:uncharacterized protein
VSRTIRIAIASDTHLSSGRKLPDVCARLLREADVILHAGDFSTEEALEEIRALGPPVHAVHGNVDEPAVVRRLPAVAEIDLDGVSLAMLHDAGTSHGRMARLRERFPDAAAVIFGHSHLPLHERAPDGFQIFNPGSPTQRRRAPVHTLGLARIANGAIAFEHVELPAP